MKKFLLVTLTALAILGMLGGAGFAGYKFGLAQGFNVAANGDEFTKPFRRGDNFGWHAMPGHDNMRPGFHRPGMGGGGFMQHGRGGFGFFSPLFLLARLAFFAFIIWVIYKLLTGWRISFTQINQKPNATETKNDNT